MKRAYIHRDEERPERTLEVQTNDEHVRIVCDSPGVASVSHVLTWLQWSELIADVDVAGTGSRS